MNHARSAFLLVITLSSTLALPSNVSPASQGQMRIVTSAADSGPGTLRQVLRPQLVAWRRDFHAHPELGFQEHRSAGLVAGHLRELGYKLQTGVAQTGVVGLLSGPATGPTVMVRVDIDALPILEESDVAYVSQ